METNDQKEQYIYSASANSSSSLLDRNRQALGAKGSDVGEDDEISINELILKIREWWKYLLSKWWIILIGGVLGGILGLAYAWFQKPLYTATTTFVLESGGDGGGGLGQYAGIASMVGLDIGGGGGGIFQGDNIIELYKSRRMIEKTLLSEVEFDGAKKLLIERYLAFNKLRQKWSSRPELKNIQFYNQTGFNRVQDSLLSEAVIDINRNYLSIAKPDKKLSIIQVDVKAEDEAFAKMFNEQIVKNVNDFYVQTKTKKALENVVILQQKTDSVRSVMNGAIYTTAAVADATPNLNPTRQVQRLAPMQRSQFTAETNKAILGELVKNLEMSKISLRKETPLIQVVDEPVYPLQKVKFGKVRGIVVGSIILGFLSLVFLSIKKKYT
jgi:predicted nucleotidyltransferase